MIGPEISAAVVPRVIPRTVLEVGFGASGTLSAFRDQGCHVLEHISEPLVFLLRLRDHLTPGGVLYIEVPSLNDISAGACQFGLRNDWHISHKVHFSSRSLALLEQIERNRTSLKVNPRFVVRAVRRFALRQLDRLGLKDTVKRMLS